MKLLIDAAKANVDMQKEVSVSSSNVEAPYRGIHILLYSCIFLFVASQKWHHVQLNVHVWENLLHINFNGHGQYMFLAIIILPVNL